MKEVAVDRLYEFVKGFVQDAIDYRIDAWCSEDRIPDWVDMLHSDTDGGTTFVDKSTGMQIDINFDAYDCSEEEK